MPFSEMAHAIQHYPKHFSHLSRGEASRRCDTSYEAYRNALHHARTAPLPTSDEHTILYLSHKKDEMCWFAWRTTLLQVNHTRAVIEIPSNFRALFDNSNASTRLPHPTGQCAYIVVHKTFGDASATMRMQYSSCSLGAAELEWMGGNPSQNSKLDLTETALSFPFADHQTETQLIEQWPCGFSAWTEESLSEFAIESVKSCERHECMRRIWEEAERAAKFSIAVSITDEEVATQFLRLSGMEVSLEARFVDEQDNSDSDEEDDEDEAEKRN